ncbi:hypothetical protein CONLIGDRAFT_644244 [Coniochaeta ligniaria NRRL 30616]|uniref:Extracellular membrane protein CFEM domain-containing protein n=1 Tax=Coniochaeta ligniaria NRRL 30616 TaxID=1408157 RepID=A0A1J7JR43_9PEZI|nr:hypothetical protein CONLIGDRAFT_644244 [Coniochaeta ligniaria NRRL 30616]
MQTRNLSLLLLVVPCVHGADGPIDWTKAPGGGPSTLRSCAQYAYNPSSRAGSIYDLGCSTISCVCRQDLINKAYTSIENAVKANCGADATVDVDQAKKIYNDYCSANGFPIAGYTYVSTATVRVSTGTATAAAATPPVSVPGSAAGGGGTAAAPNPGGGPTVTVTAAATATVFRSAAALAIRESWVVTSLLSFWLL